MITTIAQRCGSFSGIYSFVGDSDSKKVRESIGY